MNCIFRLALIASALGLLLSGCGQSEQAQPVAAPTDAQPSSSFNEAIENDPNIPEHAKNAMLPRRGSAAPAGK